MLAKIRRTPPFLLVQNALKRVPFRPVSVGRLCFLRLDGVPQVPSGLLRGRAAVRRADRQDVQQMAALHGSEAEFLQRFDAGDECVVAIDGDRIVGFEWFSSGPVHHEASWGYAIEVPEGYVYAYDAFIDPAYRNGGVWLRFKSYLAERMQQSGKRGVLTFVDYGNWASLRTHLRFGFRPAHSIIALNVLGLKLFMMAAEAIEMLG